MKTAPLRVDVELGARSYAILIGAGLIGSDSPQRAVQDVSGASGLDAGALRASVRGRQALVVTNDVVAPLYLERVLAALGDARLAVSSLVLPDGEAHKTLDAAARVFAALASLKASRDATIVALGGGVIGDVAGFAAACWMRGIAVVQVPTTLLAMVDSSVGGKTGIDLPQGKNLVGAFHQPRAVIADTDTLATLPERELRAGLGEVVKYGALGDAAFFAWLERHVDALLARDAATLTAAIAACCRHKAAIVARDETESGERALLNFGHTFGHALETAGGYHGLLHGEAIAIGMVLAARLSVRLDMAAGADGARLTDLLRRCGLPTALPDGTDTARLLELMRLDKKNVSGQLRLILWRGIGRAEIAQGVDERAILAVLDEARSLA